MNCRHITVFTTIELKRLLLSVLFSSQNVIATYEKEESGMDLVIRLPSCYPLCPMYVDCTRSLGISEVKQRKWLLSMIAFVRNQVILFPTIFVLVNI